MYFRSSIDSAHINDMDVGLDPLPNDMDVKSFVSPTQSVVEGVPYFQRQDGHPHMQHNGLQKVQRGRFLIRFGETIACDGAIPHRASTKLIALAAAVLHIRRCIPVRG